MGSCPCPHCLVPKGLFGYLGLMKDMRSRLTNLRVYAMAKVIKAREFIYQLGNIVDGAKVEDSLWEGLWVPTLVNETGSIVGWLAQTSVPRISLLINSDRSALIRFVCSLSTLCMSANWGPGKLYLRTFWGFFMPFREVLKPSQPSTPGMKNVYGVLLPANHRQLIPTLDFVKFRHLVMEWYANFPTTPPRWKSWPPVILKTYYRYRFSFVSFILCSLTYLPVCYSGFRRAVSSWPWCSYPVSSLSICAMARTRKTQVTLRLHLGFSWWNLQETLSKFAEVSGSHLHCLQHDGATKGESKTVGETLRNW